MRRKSRHAPKLVVFILAIALQLVSSAASAIDLRFAQWDALLKKIVIISQDGKDSSVDYASVKASPNELKAVITEWSQLPRAAFDKMHKNDQMAFLINTYNASTISLVAKNYPIESIKKIGVPLVGPWKKSFIHLFGDRLSLDTLEHDMLRKDYQLATIHFGVNCASLSCPPLRAGAFTGADLKNQLENQALLFFSNNRENSYDSNAKTLTLNPILKWFREDFSKTGEPGTVMFVAKYFPELAKALSMGAVTADTVKVRYGDYNWNLNDVKKR